MSPLRAWRSAAALVAALALAVPAGARASSAAGRPWFVPDHAKVQLAGQIGFLSPGVGYDLASGRVHLDLFLGWVPASVGGHDIFSTTAKLGYAPWRVRAAARGWHLVPLTVGVQATYTFGAQYFVTSPGRYPSGYYEIPTALDLGLSVGGAVLREFGGGERALGLYAELVALVKDLRELHHNPRTVGVADVVTFAAGAMVRF